MPDIQDSEKQTLKSMNYNDRLDGYGFGEADSLDLNREYEHDPHFIHHNIDLGEGYRCHKNEPFTRDELGLRNQYGPVDQYSFRDVFVHIRAKQNGPWDRIKKILFRKK